MSKSNEKKSDTDSKKTNHQRADERYNKKFYKRMTLRFTREQYQVAIQNWKKQSKYSFSEYIIQCSIDKKITVIDNSFELAINEEAIRNFLKIGNNLNQIARQFNQERGGQVSNMVNDLFAELTALRQKIEEVNRNIK